MSEFQQTMSGIMTGLLLIIFIGICIWSWSGKRKDNFDRMANLPLEDDSTDISKLNNETRDIKEKREASL